jgi:hypothetical protein
MRVLILGAAGFGFSKRVVWIKPGGRTVLEFDSRAMSMFLFDHSAKICACPRTPQFVALTICDTAAS